LNANVWNIAHWPGSLGRRSVAAASFPASRQGLVLGLQRLRATRFASLVEGQLLHPGLRLLQKPVTVVLEGLAALIDGDALLKLNVASLQPANGALKLL